MGTFFWNSRESYFRYSNVKTFVSPQGSFQIKVLILTLRVSGRYESVSSNLRKRAKECMQWPRHQASGTMHLRVAMVLVGIIENSLRKFIQVSFGIYYRPCLSHQEILCPMTLTTMTVRTLFVCSFQIYFFSRYKSRHFFYVPC